LEAFNEALRNIDRLIKLEQKKGEKTEENKKLEAIKISTLFNIAYWYETDHQYDEASSRYKEVKDKHPDYIDAFLRLAYLARMRGNVSRAFFWIEESAKSRAKAPVNQYCLKGKILMDRGDTTEAEKTFRFVIEKIYNADTYSFLGLANLAYKKGMDLKLENQDQQDRLLVRAYNKYLDILANDQSNCFACIGLANILAYFNKTEDAQEIFKLMAESNQNLYQPLMNRAHLSIGEKNFEIAINLYQNILEKFLPNDLKTEMFLSKAYFIKGDYD